MRNLKGCKLIVASALAATVRSFSACFWLWRKEKKGGKGTKGDRRASGGSASTRRDESHQSSALHGSSRRVTAGAKNARSARRYFERNNEPVDIGTSVGLESSALILVDDACERLNTRFPKASRSLRVRERRTRTSA